MNSSVSSSIETLTPIWQRVLRRPRAGVHDDFFELGGTPESAIELFDEIAREFNRRLSPLLIYSAPDIASLASRLDQQLPPHLPPLVPLKSGTACPPIFLVHGMGGSVMDFFHLANHLQLPNPIYGLQAKGSDGLDDPLETIEDMAQFHLDAIRDAQPHGPYIFIGHSLGGLVALEMARLVTSAGEPVALLAMLDSYLHPSHLSFEQRTRVFARRVKNYAVTRLRKLLHLSSNSGNRPPLALSQHPETQRVRAGAYLAFTRYTPHFYPGEIRFVEAATASIYPRHPEAIWGAHAKRIQVETVPGDHSGMLSTHVESLAPVLSRYIQEALCHH